MKRKISLSLVCCLAVFVSACNRQGPPEATDTATSGTVTIVADESYTPLFQTMEYTFEKLYKNADVTIRYKNETDALSDLINDSCKVAVLNRDLNAEEKKLFEQKNIYPKSTKIAQDAVAFIVNNSNPDTLLTIDQIRAILSGADSLWTDISKGSALSGINIVFDNKGSANARFLKDSLLKGGEFQKKVFAVNSNPEVINYVNSHPNALGVISVNWISDKDDSLTKGFMKQVKVVGVAGKMRSDSTYKYFKPYQAYIKTRDYPLVRDVFMINRQTRAGLGTGFVSFVAGDKGQRMILKSGLIPATMPVRVVHFQ